MNRMGPFAELPHPRAESPNQDGMNLNSGFVSQLGATGNWESELAAITLLLVVLLLVVGGSRLCGVGILA